MTADRRTTRKQQPCTCPHDWRNSRDYGREWLRLSTTPGCLEHDACHHYDGSRDAWGVAKWCPIHEAKGCPDA